MKLKRQMYHAEIDSVISSINSSRDLADHVLSIQEAGFGFVVVIYKLPDGVYYGDLVSRDLERLEYKS